MNTATLYIFSGLPASGKTTLSKLLAKDIKACYIRIDTIESALCNLYNTEVESEGYRLSYCIARDNLKLGVSTIADSCNTVKITREEWEQSATGAGACYKNIEICCSDLTEHKRRVESRKTDGVGGNGSRWLHIQKRYYEKWHKSVISIDTAGRSVPESYEELKKKLAL